MIKYQPMNSAGHSVAKIIASVFYIGHIHFAPGTFGTLAGVAFIWLLQPSYLLQASVLAVTIIIGIKAADIAEVAYGQKDSGKIVIDEVAGYFCSIIFLPLTPEYMIAAFFLFRLFDIWKPWPIRLCEQLKGGMGVMMDDVAAGVLTNIILQGFWLFFLSR
jgi:phosphatidylglycerophosphatase A